MQQERSGAESRSATEQEQSFDVSERNARTRHDPMPATVAAFQVRGRFLTALAIRIDTEAAGEAFYAQLDDQLRRTPQFFAGAPVVIDLINAPGFSEPSRMRELVENLRARDLRVFGVQSARGIDAAALQQLGLISVLTGRDAPLPREGVPARAAA
ncbi:septum site-determining protein MinC, partial [Paracoccus liaowanqingii]